MCVQQFEQLKPLDGPHWLLEPGHHVAGQFCLHFFLLLEDIGPMYFRHSILYPTILILTFLITFSSKDN